MGGISGVLQTVVPVSIGFAGGLVIPKLLKVTDWKAIAFPVGAGILTIIFGRHLVGSKSANLAGAGMIGAGVVALLDKYVLQKTKEIGGVLKEDETFPSLSDVQASVGPSLMDVEAQTLSAVSSVPGLTQDENDLSEEDDGLASNMYNRFGKYDEVG